MSAAALARPAIWTTETERVACPDSDRARLWRLELARRIEVIERRIQRLEAQKKIRIARLTAANAAADDTQHREGARDVPSK